jgi:hypothetical protein
VPIHFRYCSPERVGTSTVAWGMPSMSSVLSWVPVVRTSVVAGTGFRNRDIHVSVRVGAHCPLLVGMLRAFVCFLMCVLPVTSCSVIWVRVMLVTIPSRILESFMI